MTDQAPWQTPIRVLQLARWVHSSGGGIRSYLASIAAALHDSPVLIMAASVGPSYPPDYLSCVPHTGALNTPEIINAWSFWRWARKGVTKADVVHIHGVFGWVFLLGAVACALTRTPYVVSPHGAFAPWFMMRKPLKKQLYLKLIGLPLLRRAKAIVATSDRNVEEIRAVDRDLNVVLVTPGVRVPERPTVRFLVEAQPPTRLRILYLGRLDAVKDIPTLLRAIHSVRQQGIDAELQLVGWGTPEASAEAEAVTKALGLEQQIRFRGYLDGEHKREVLETSDVMAIPSHSENFSFAAAEALAIGLPVVTTSGVAMSRLIAENRCGNVVPPGDVKAFTQALLACTEIAEHRERALRAHATAQRELSLDTMGALLQSVYRDARAW